MDKFFNAFGFGLAVLLASTLTTQSRNPAVESTLVPTPAVVVADPIAAQGNAAVREIEKDARDAARAAKAAALPELVSLEIAER
ncbi:MAG TPA: hypothetical protein VFB36_05370 [Nevskiaceae bacterium]|nr:hypothetical protein [Nevskiaceae bacterium]